VPVFLDFASRTTLCQCYQTCFSSSLAVELNKLTLIPEIFQPNLAFAGKVESLTISPSIERGWVNDPHVCQYPQES
jgi:hypothetical protein